jgi:hypothetical protein
LHGAGKLHAFYDLREIEIYRSRAKRKGGERAKKKESE